MSPLILVPTQAAPASANFLAKFVVQTYILSNSFLYLWHVVFCPSVVIGWLLWVLMSAWGLDSLPPRKKKGWLTLVAKPRMSLSGTPSRELLCVPLCGTHHMFVCKSAYVTVMTCNSRCLLLEHFSGAECLRRDAHTWTTPGPPTTTRLILQRLQGCCFQIQISTSQRATSKTTI